ncbi:hypothetical protein J4Q44_G00081220 [Coregonus suidteri]|uniref:Uncharacterized protein n=1 Tax=Coregonus suidteri TaxID=861788 RepID=A0AAN8MA64_9TELE
MDHIVDPIEVFSVGLDQSGDTLLSEEESIQGNEEDANTDSNTTGGLDTSEVILLSEEEVSDRVLLVNESIQGNEEGANTDSNTTGGLDTSEVILLSEEEVSDRVLLVNESVQDQGVNAANTDSNQSPSPNRRRKMGSTRKHPRGAQREEEGTEEKQEGEIESTEAIEDKGENMEVVEGSCIEFEMLMESKDGAGNEKNEGEEKNEESVLTDLSCSFSTSNQEGRNIEADNIESESQSIIKESMATKLMLTADMEQRLFTPSNSPNLPSKSSLSLSSQSHEDVGESKATGKRINMVSTHRTREAETQETGENVTEAEVRAEAIGNPEVNAVLERFQEEHRAEAVSLEDQQERQSTEKEVVASSTALSGIGSEQVAPAPQPGPGNKRGQEKAERVEKVPVTREKKIQPPGTFGSSGSRSNPYNVVMVGNSSVGKTSFMRRFQSGEFCLHHDATIGIDTCIQSVTVDASPVTLQLWDTAGQERFHSITRQVFHKAQGLLLIYDITSSQSFCDVRYWVNCIQEGAPDDVIVILLGNKTDCAELQREVQTHEGENLAKRYDMLFMECSAATGDNVTLSMETLARMLKKVGEETRQEEGSLVLQKEPPKKKSGCC